MPGRPTPRDSHIDAALTNVSIAYKNDLYIASQIFPVVPVQKKSDAFFIFDKASWFRVANKSLRAPGTKAARIDYTLSTGSYNCTEKALAKGVSDEERDNADNPLSPEISAVEFVTDQLMLLNEKRVADLVSACANWKNSVTPSVLWDTESSDPLSDIDTARDTIIQEIGREPNTMIIGWEVWTALKKHPDLMDRIKYTQRGILTTDLAASLFEIENLLVGKAVFDSAVLEGQSASMGFVWGKQATLMYVPSAPALMVPAAGYVFSWRTFQSSRFHEDQERNDVFEVRHSTAEKITGSDSGYVISGVVS